MPSLQNNSIAYNILFAILTASCLLLLYLSFLNEKKIIEIKQINSRCVHNLSPSIVRTSRLQSTANVIPETMRPMCLIPWTKLVLIDVELNLKKSGFQRLKFQVLFLLCILVYIPSKLFILEKYHRPKILPSCTMEYLV